MSAVIVFGSIYYCLQTLQLDSDAMRNRLAVTPDHPILKLDDDALRRTLVLGVVLAVSEGVFCTIIGVLCLKQRRSGYMLGIVISSLRLLIALLVALAGLLMNLVESLAGDRSDSGAGRLSLIASMTAVPFLIVTIVLLAIALRRARKFPPSLPARESLSGL